MLLSSSYLSILFVASGSFLLILAQLSLISASATSPTIKLSSCPTPPTIKLAQYNQITGNTTISQMKTILGGLGVLLSSEFADPFLASSNSLTYTYQGANQVYSSASASGSSNSYASFTFSPSTQKLRNKMQYGLC